MDSYDIYYYAKKYGTDLIDSQGNVYKIAKYNEYLKAKIPTPGIEVYDYEGNFLGIARKKDLRK